MAIQGGYGLKLKITVGTTLTAVANLLDAGFPEQVKELFDVTSHPTSGTTGYRQFQDTGLRELTEFDADLQWDVSETTHAAILTAFDATDPVNMSIEDPDGAEVIAFSGHIRRVGRLSAMTEAYRAMVSIRPTGAPTIT